MDGDHRVSFRFTTTRGIVEGEGTLIGQGPAGGAIIPSGTHTVLSIKHGGFEILPDQQPSVNQDNQ